MNNGRRKELAKLATEADTKLYHLFADWKERYDALVQEFEEELKSKFEDFKSEIEALRDEEQEYRENMPESLQQSEKADLADAAVSAMEAAIEEVDKSIEIDFINELPDDFSEAIAQLEEAQA